ncbi:MAG: DUF3488 and transglutaminase-like domain-containing protein [Actinomycetota bacterium]
MTATVERPAAASSAPPAAPAAAPRQAAPRAAEPIAAELALTVVTLAAVAGLSRLFDDNSVLVDLLLAGLAAHVIASITRRVGFGMIRSTLAQLVVLVLVTAWVRYPTLQAYGLPTSDTLDAARTDLTAAWDAFGVVKAPTEPLPGFVLAGMIGVWVVAFGADTTAFRARLPVHALVPSFVLVLFVGMLGVDDGRILGAVGYTALALFFLLTYRLDRRPRRTDAARRRRTHQLATGAALVGLAAVVGGVGGPALPGAESEPLFDWKELDGSGGGTRVTLSPLVDIRGRLVDQAPVEVFTVVADERAYWRTTALDRFDGAVWGGKWAYDVVSGELDITPPPVAQVTNRQTYTVSQLADIWLPAAYLPVRIDQGDVQFDADSATLIGNGRTETGFTYTVESISPRFDADTLRRAQGEIPAELLERYTELPADFSEVARAEAERVTADGATTYDKMRLLQDYFIGNFTYDIDVASGHDSGRVETFLSERRGYCEQFAGTFAAMARHLGIPARVAVGFTWGELIGENTYSVRGEHYHAWPEIWFPEVGWVPFEPTPGRGAPNSFAYTGLPEQQEGAIGATPTTTEAPLTDDAEALSPQTPIEPELPDLEALDPGATGADGAAGGDGSGGLPGPVLAVGATALAGGAAWVLLVPLASGWSRERRRRRAADEGARVDAAWRSLVTELSLDGLIPHEAETRREYAGRAAAHTGLSSTRLDGVAREADQVGFSRAPSSSATATIDEADALAAELRKGHTGWERFRRAIDPRPLAPSWPRRRPGSPPAE